MKDKLISFVILFVGILVSLYLFASDRDIGGMVFVSAGTALILTLAENHMKKIFDIVMKKITKQQKSH